MRRAGRTLFFLTLATTVAAQSPVPAPAKAPPPGQAQPAPSTDELFEIGKQLFDQLAPPEIKAQYEFPSKEQWDAFAVRLQRVLEGGSLEELAGYEPEARAALDALRLIDGYEDYADWLEQRIDEMQGAKQALTPVAPPRQPPTRPTSPTTPPKPTQPGKKTPSATGPRPSLSTLPHYDLWLARVRARPVPARAATLMPRLRAAFVAEGVPPEIAWLAEAESSLNPAARSPVGAKGLFQFMPETAKAMNLSTFLPDDRTDPEKSARAAARYLKTLHGKFGDWPLAFAAYNAGEGRVRRTLTAQGGKDFASIATSLPAETRMYVPKVCALIAVRAGVAPEKIAAPGK